MEPSNIATFYSQFGICQVGGCTSNTSHFKFIMIFFNFEILKKENLFISIFLDDSKTLMRLRLHIYFVKTLFKGINPPPHTHFLFPCFQNFLYIVLTMSKTLRSCLRLIILAYLAICVLKFSKCVVVLN